MNADHDQQDSQKEQRPVADVLAGEQLECAEIETDDHPDRAGAKAYPAEEVHGAAKKAQHEINGHQIQYDPDRAVEPKTAVLGFPFGARPVVDRHLGQRYSDPARQGGDKAVHLAVQLDVLHYFTAIGAQRATRVVQFDAGCAGDQLVGQCRGEFANEIVLAVPPPSGYQVIPLGHGVQQLGDVGRVVLKVRIQGDNDLAPGKIKTGGKGGRLPKVAPKADHHYARIRLVQGLHQLKAAVGTTVVHQHDFVALYHPLKRSGDLLVQRANIGRLVIDRRHHRQCQPIPVLLHGKGL